MKKEKKLTAEEKVERYFNTWGSDKRTLVSIVRGLIFILGLCASILTATWVVMNNFLPWIQNDTMKIITNNVAIISVVFIGFVFVLDAIYMVTISATMNKNKLNRIPSIVVGYIITILLAIFVILTCIEIFGVNQGKREYLYSIYMVICFSCCVFSAIACFDQVKGGPVKFNPNNKLIKSLSYTIGFLGILAVLTFILWIMWYPTNNEKLSETCFLLARTTICLVGDALIKMLAQIILIIAIKCDTPYGKKRAIVLSLLWCALFAFTMWSGSLFIQGGSWKTNTTYAKISMIMMILFTIATSAININIASRYATRLEKR